MGVLDNKSQQEPFHAGEVYNLWSYLYNTKNALVMMQVFINHTGDQDLKTLLEDIQENCLTQEEQQVEAILKEAGIRLPPAPPDRPNVEVQDIPAGARLNDAEISVLMQKELTAGKLFCSYMMGISIQEEIHTLFDDFHNQKAEYDMKLAKMMKEKGWFISPPLNIK